MSTVRILIVSHSVAQWTVNFARFFACRGDELLVASFSPTEIEGIKMESIGAKKYDCRKGKHRYFTRVPRLRRVIRRFNPDIVFAIYLTSNGLTAALSWDGPFVVSAVGSDVLDREGRKGLRKCFREGVIKLVARRADVINTVSQELDDELSRLGVPSSKLFQLPFGVDTDVFHSAEDMPRRKVSRFICTRSHNPIYDIPTVIGALALLKEAGREFYCTFTSGGPVLEDNKVRVRAAGLEDCVTFTGFLDHGELPNLLRQSDIYISASVGDGTSISLLEAMATGLVPVVSRIRANEPWVEHGRTGLLFEVGRPDMLAQALQRVMDDEQLRRRAFEENIPRVNRDCNMHRNMQRLANVFEQLIEGKKPDLKL
jgi:glycosyltransferase involved in cell wall biosynthesis